MSLSSPAPTPRDADPGPYYQSDRSELYAFARRSGLGPCARVLNVGCAAGADAQQLRALGAQVLCGVEPAPQAAAAARRTYDQVFEATLEDYVWDGTCFDLIVFADSLEHMRDPGAALTRVRAWVPGRGALLISIPNVRHIGVIWEILRGDFRYRDAGILDRTHLRFFTSRSFLRILNEAGWRCETMRRWGAMRSARWVAHAVPGTGEFVQSQVFIIARRDDAARQV